MSKSSGFAGLAEVHDWLVLSRDREGADDTQIQGPADSK
jgi:hypothetical protein